MRLLLLVSVVVLLSGTLGRAAEEDSLHEFPEVPADAFRPSSLCARCHSEGRRATAMRDGEGTDISPFGLWQSSMMANASRDPVWRAAVAVEVAGTPSRGVAIEAACLRCHAPMVLPGMGMAGLVLTGADDELASDGASCTVCHRIQAEGLGEEASFSGAWVIDDADRVFGPHADPFARPMRMQTGLMATESAHILESALCGTCHTLTTPTLDPEGRPTGGHLPEQTPYLEWRNSSFSTEAKTPSNEARSCQSCHMPQTDEDGSPIRTRIARNPGGRDFPPTREREPYGQHVLVGANTLTPRILRGREEILGVFAPEEAFDRTLAAAADQLRSAGSLDLDSLQRLDGELHFALRISNHAGHRLPTAHPTRRVWVSVRVFDGNHEPLFASGIWDAKGRIVGPDGKPLPAEMAGGPTYPHQDRVTSSSEVALYEAQMVDWEGKPTWLLIRGERFLKDNRLLPRGWRADGPHPEATLPRGVEGDDDFGAGGDVVNYSVSLSRDVVEPIYVEARLVHQTIGARWLAEWSTYELPAVRLLESLLLAEPPTPSVVSTLDVEVRRGGTRGEVR